MASTTSASDVKSTAVVKYSSVKMPVQFSTIGLNTDLNHPPTNQPGCTVYFDRSMPASCKFSQFVSVNMAHTNQELVGKVDVISSSKNIKALLKMPYSPSPQISIMVHRLRNTLLLEEFDVYKHLIRKQTEEWSWLRSYFYEVIAKEEKEKQSKFLDGGPTNRESSLYMNLIRHSFAASGSEAVSAVVPASVDDAQQVNVFRDPTQDLKGFQHETLWKFQDISMLINSDLPIFGGGSARRPCISLRLRDSRSPPINILTGLDYWLDNLMSNVPEVAMCYHINGLVQKYEVMKTEDIPNLENSSFDPNEVLDIAQNIMSFIKRNAAVEGHTYWLYKSENDDMVKLYDLTNLCKDKIVTGENPFTVPVGLLCHRVARNLKFSGQRRNADSRAMFENCIRLLDDSKYCQECVDAHFHLSDMWVPDKSVNDIWQEKGKISDPPVDLYDEHETESDDSSNEEEKSDLAEGVKSESVSKPSGDADVSKEKEVKNSVALKELVVRGLVKKRAWQTVQASRIAGTTDQRCREALSHIRKGLSCVDKDMIREKSENDAKRQQPKSPSRVIPLPYTPLNINTQDNLQTRDQASSSAKAEQEPLMSNPWKAIPLPYKTKVEATESQEHACSNDRTDLTLGAESPENRGTESSSNESTVEDEWTRPSKTGEETSWKKSWHSQAKFQLLRKAAITYFVLAKEFFEIKKYGHSLRHLRYAVHCYESLELLDSRVRHEDQDSEFYMMLLYLAAQARTCLYPNWSAARHDFEDLGEEEAAILHSAQAVVATPKMSWMYEWSPSLQANLLTAVDLFERTLKLPSVEKKPKSFQIAMKKDYAGCVMNLGNVQMEICKEKILKNKEPMESVKPVVHKAMDSFQKAIKLFDAVGERNTAAHNYSNVSYVHTLAAAALHDTSAADDILPPEEKEHLLKSIEFSEKCARHYERGEKMDEARERAYHNIRLQYQQMASQYFYKPAEKITEEDIDNMREFLQKSLKYCFLDSQGRYLKASQSMAANNNLNLAKVYEVEAHRCRNPTRKKHLRQKTGEHFQKAMDLHKQLNWPKCEMCTAFVWSTSLFEELENGSLTSKAKKKLLRNALCLLCDLKGAVETISKGEGGEGDETPLFKTDGEAVQSFLTYINSSFSAILRIDSSNQEVKNLYKRSLRMTAVSDPSQLYPQLIRFLEDLKSALSSELIH